MADNGLIQAYIVHEDLIEIFDHEHRDGGERCERNGNRISCNGSRDKYAVRDVFTRAGERVNAETKQRVLDVMDGTKERTRPDAPTRLGT